MVYNKRNLPNGLIQRSSSPAAAPILLAKKKDGGLCLSMDHHALNRATVKNRYPLPVISEMLDRLRGAQIITKLDLRNAYHLISIKQGNEYTTALRMRYGQFNYQLMPFRLTNTPATFQAYIDDCLRPIIHDFDMCYFVDILIYSIDEEQHEEQVQTVLDWLGQFGLYTKAKK
jgi:hypothetical protein